MSICDSCIHDNVCGLEDNHEEGIISCSDRIPKNVLNKIRAEIEQDAFKDANGSKYIFVNRINQILDKYRAESEDI